MFLLLFTNPFWEKRYQVRALKSGSNSDYILSQEFWVPSVRSYGIYKILNIFLFISYFYLIIAFITLINTLMRPTHSNSLGQISSSGFGHYCLIMPNTSWKSHLFCKCIFRGSEFVGSCYLTNITDTSWCLSWIPG